MNGEAEMNMFKTIDRRTMLRAAAAGGVLTMIRPTDGWSATKAPLVMTGGVSGLVLHQMALDEGYFKQFDLDPELLIVSDGTKATAALIGGASDICMWSGFNQLTPAIEKGATLKILAGALNIPSLAIYSKMPDIKTVSDLVGKTIGIGAPGSVLHQMIGLMLKKKGISIDKVTFRNAGSNADIFKAVVAGTVDAGPSDVDVFEQQDKFGVHALSDGLLWKEIPEYTNQGTYASDDAIKSRRELLVRILATYGKVYRYVQNPASRDAFIKARAKVTNDSDEHQAVTQWNWIQAYQPYAQDLVLSDERINLVQQLNVDFGVQTKVLPIAQVADMSLAKDALKLMA